MAAEITARLYDDVSSRVRRPGRPGWGSATPSSLEAREADDESRALARGGLGGDRAAVIVDDPVDDRQAQAGAGGLRRVERVEDLGQRFGVHAVAGVRHDELHGTGV